MLGVVGEGGKQAIGSGIRVGSARA